MNFWVVPGSREEREKEKCIWCLHSWNYQAIRENIKKNFKRTFLDIKLKNFILKYIIGWCIRINESHLSSKKKVKPCPWMLL